MPFQKFNSTNNANCLLDAPITESSNTLNLKGTFGRFPTANFIVCVTERDIDGEVIFRENMLISTRSGNVCNIQTRAYEAVPQTDDSLTNVAESYDFSSDSEVEVVVSSAFVKDIQDEVTRLESDKLNKGGLRTALANTWRMFFSNGSNNETEIAFEAAGLVLTSNGVSAAPSWEVPTLDINGLTEDATGNIENDFFPKNNGTGVNTKIKMTRYKASNAEATDGTNDVKYITSKGVKDNYFTKSQIIKGTFNFDDVAQSNVTISHSLGRTPKGITVILAKRISGTGVTINQDSIVGAWSDNNGSITNIAYSNGDSGGFWESISESNGDILKFTLGSGEGTWKVQSTSSTNVVFSYSYTDFGTLYPFVYDVYFKIDC